MLVFSLNFMIISFTIFILISFANTSFAKNKKQNEKTKMKKITMLLCVFMSLFTISACSNSIENVYGYWKAEKAKDVTRGGEFLLAINEKEIVIKQTSRTIKNIEQENGTFIFDVNDFIKYMITPIDKNTIEYAEVLMNEKKSLGKFVRISKEEYETIKNKPIKKDPPLNEYPSLF